MDALVSVIVIITLIGIGILLLNQFSSLRREVGNRLENVSGQVDQRLAVFSQIQETLGALTEGTKRLQELGQDMARLQTLLQPPKLRGEVGELLLENLLAYVLPQGTYSRNHRFSDGTTVEFVVSVGDGIVAIDSKFPRETFVQLTESVPVGTSRHPNPRLIDNVKRHAESVAKYVRPNEGTLPFAIMYVPAEGIYHEAFLLGERADELRTHCWNLKVFAASPNTLYPLLACIALGLRGLQVEKHAQQILGELAQLEQELRKVDEPLGMLGRHLKNAADRYDDVRKAWDRLDNRLSALIPSTSNSEDGQVELLEGAESSQRPQP